MTSGPRDYAAGVLPALAVLSEGTCYYPACRVPIVVFIDGEPFRNFYIAHIREANPGNRYEPEMSNDDRRSFLNLVLLCKPHHTLVDKTHPERFGVEDLERWKAEREGPGLVALKGLSGLTESRLAELITAATQAALDEHGRRSLPLAWTEPATWQINRQGVQIQASGGWQLVVANDTDELVREWIAVARSPNGDCVAAAGSAAAHGVLPPRTRRVLDIPPPSGRSHRATVIPEHYPLDVNTSFSFVDHEEKIWERRDGSAPRSLPHGDEVFELPAGAPVASLAVPTGIDRQGVSIRRLV